MEVEVTTGAISHDKFGQIVTASNRTPSFLQAGCPSCHPADSMKALKEETPRACLLQAHLGSSNLIFDH